ncbi:MAG: hypothetical protein II328_04145 [Clostridia bacterium]|nr:hypothetical protein [Clostridia bacterium]
MKRAALFMIALLLLLPLYSCQTDKTEENILLHLALPMEFDCTFQMGEFDGNAHVCLKEESINFGITDGPLTGLVISVTDQSARFLYEGMDVSFSSDTAKKFLLLREAFTFLRNCEFDPNAAEASADLLSFTFSDKDATIVYSIHREDCSPAILSLKTDTQVFTLQFS